MTCVSFAKPTLTICLFSPRARTQRSTLQLWKSFAAVPRETTVRQALKVHVLCQRDSMFGRFHRTEGVRMDPAKSQLITDCPIPQTRHQLQPFLDTCVYVLKYCADFAALSAPLTELTKGKSKNECIMFEDTHHDAFQELEQRLSNPPVLANLNFNVPFHVSMNAND